VLLPLPPFMVATVMIMLVTSTAFQISSREANQHKNGIGFAPDCLPFCHGGVHLLVDAVHRASGAYPLGFAPSHFSYWVGTSGPGPRNFLHSTIKAARREPQKRWAGCHIYGAAGCQVKAGELTLFERDGQCLRGQCLAGLCFMEMGDGTAARSTLAMVPCRGWRSLGLRRALLSLAAVALAGCSMTDGAGSILVDPGRYAAYHCNDLTARWKVLVVREKQLRGLIDKANEGGGAGAVIGSLAYRTDYDSVLTEEKLVQRAAADKNCAFTAEFQSDQTIR
jgi:hypothetical protein